MHFIQLSIQYSMHQMHSRLNCIECSMHSDCSVLESMFECAFALCVLWAQMPQCNPRTQHMSLSARIALEAMPMTSGPQAAAASLALRKAAASSWTARRSSVVVDAIELACVGVAHEARAALSGLGWQRHGRWCRVRALSGARRSRPSDLSLIFLNHM